MAEKLVLPDGKKILTRDFTNVIKSVDVNKRQIVMRGTDETVDRQGEVVMMSGWDLKNYLKNPVFLWAHDYGSVPLAAASKVIKKKGSDPHLLFYLDWPTKELFPFADMILNLYQEKIINASSVGFFPLKSENMDEDAESYWAPQRYLKQDLLELSGCAVPCNPNAVQSAVKSIGGIKAWVEYIIGEQKHMSAPDNADDILEEVDKLRQNVEFIDETKKTQVVIDGNKDEVFETSKSEEVKAVEEVLVNPNGKFDEDSHYTKVENSDELIEELEKDITEEEIKEIDEEDAVVRDAEKAMSLDYEIEVNGNPVEDFRMEEFDIEDNSGIKIYVNYKEVEVEDEVNSSVESLDDKSIEDKCTEEDITKYKATLFPEKAEVEKEIEGKLTSEEITKLIPLVKQVEQVIKDNI